MQTDIDTEDLYFQDCVQRIINGIQFEACLRRPGSFTVVDSKKEIVYAADDGLASFEFFDLNADGFDDILLNQLTNIPGIRELLLFDPKTSSFKTVEGFRKFPAAVKIDNTDFYYSYHRSGCADSNWDSDLFKLIDNKAVRFGNIHGIGCAADLESGIYINKIEDSSLTQIGFVAREEGYWEGKWNFIAEYWTNNYKKFE